MNTFLYRPTLALFGFIYIIWHPWLFNSQFVACCMTSLMVSSIKIKLTSIKYLIFILWNNTVSHTAGRWKWWGGVIFVLPIQEFLSSYLDPRNLQLWLRFSRFSSATRDTWSNITSSYVTPASFHFPSKFKLWQLSHSSTLHNLLSSKASLRNRRISQFCWITLSLAI